MRGEYKCCSHWESFRPGFLVGLVVTTVQIHIVFVANNRIMSAWNGMRAKIKTSNEEQIGKQSTTECMNI